MGDLENDERGIECPICFKDFNEKLKIFQCQNGHTYCEECFNGWIWLKKKKCLICSVTITQQIRNTALENFVATASKLPEDPTSKSTAQQTIHTGITCDGNHNPSLRTEIRGHRYKCIECEDFNLCSSCFKMDVHAEHLFLCFRDDEKRKKIIAL